MTKVISEKEQAELLHVEIRLVADESPDLSYLDQYSNAQTKQEREYYRRGQERKAEYGQTWEMIGIIAVGTVFDPHPEESREIQSAGLWGIESDSGSEYLLSVAEEELADLMEIVRESGCAIPENIEAMKQRALFSFKKKAQNLPVSDWY